MTYAPIALFTYNRADHTRAAVESLQQNAEAKDSDLFIFSDGAKTPEKQKGVDENRKYIHTISGFNSVTIIEREKNWGLANSLIAGITELTEKYGRAIVVEDDLVLSPYFLKFMNDGLEKYKDDNRVACIGSFIYPTGIHSPNIFFLHYFSCWGWATWKRAWNKFNPNANEMLKRLRWNTRKFNMDGSHDFYGMLYCQKLGLIDSWAIRFYASFFLEGMLQLFPGVSLCIQTGTDGSGTHCDIPDTQFDGMKTYDTPINVEDISVEECKKMRDAYVKYLYGMNKNCAIKRTFYQMKSFIRRLIGIDYI